MNKLYFGDNLDVLRDHIDQESVDLVYLEPPFNSQENYNVLFKERTAGPSGLTRRVPSGVNRAGGLVAQLEALQDFNVAWHRRCALRNAASCRGHRFQLQLQRDKIPRRHKQRNVRGSVPIFRLDDVVLRRTLGGRA